MKSKKKEKKEHIVSLKLLYTALIVLLYLMGRKIPLFYIDTAAYQSMAVEESLLLQMIGGDAYRYSVFALGVSPYISASILVQVYSNYRKKSHKGALDVGKTNRLTVGLCLFFTVWQAVVHVRKLIFVPAAGRESWIYAIAVLEMIAGVMVVLWLSARNKQYGIGGRTMLIYVNIVDGMLNTLKKQEWSGLAIPLMVSVVVVFVMLIMENTQVRLPLQRISIYSLNKDKDYLPLKLNPIGVMPVIYSSAIFSLFGMLAGGLAQLFPKQSFCIWLSENVVQYRPLGIGLYLGIICVLTMLLSGVFLNLDEVTEQLLKNGDSILDVYAGEDTKKYLTGKLRRLSVFSALVMCACVGGPLILQCMGKMNESLSMFPVSVMMMVGIWNQLHQEVDSLRCLEKYHMFI